MTLSATSRNRACLDFQFDIQSTAQKLHRLKTPFEAIAMLCFLFNSQIPLVRSSSELHGKLSVSVSVFALVWPMRTVRDSLCPLQV